MSYLCRQLSVLCLLILSTPSFAQSAAGGRAAVVNGGAMSYPGMPNQAPTMFIKALTIDVTKLDNKEFAEFYLNPDLSLGFQYNYRFNFDFSLRTSKGDTAVPDGYYLLTVASFVKFAPHLKDGTIPGSQALQDRFVTVNVPRVVRVIGGIAKEEMFLRFDNPTQGSVTNTLYVEFKPLTCPKGEKCLEFKPNGDVDTQRSRLIPAKGYSQFMLSMPWVPAARIASGDTNVNADQTPDTQKLSTIGLREFANTVQTFRDKQYAALGTKPITPREYAEANNLQLMDFNDPRLFNAGQRYLRKDIRQILHTLLSNYQSKPIHLPDSQIPLRTVFCDLILTTNAGLQNSPNASVWRNRGTGLRVDPLCNTNAEALQIRRNLHVGRVNSQDFAKTGKINPFKYVLMQNILSGRSHDESASDLKTFKVWSFLTSPAKAITAPISALGGILAKDITGNIPFDWSHNVTTSNSRTHNESGIESKQEYMDVTPVIASTNASRVQACLEVRMPTEYLDPQTAKNPANTRGFYICDKMVDQAVVDESYMHAVTRMNDTSAATAYDRKSQTLNLLARGDGEMSDFFRRIRSSLRPDAKNDSQAQTMLPSWYSEEAMRYFANRTGRGMNLISTPVIIGKEAEVPSLIGKLMGLYEEKFDK